MLDTKTKELIAIGAAVAAKGQPCLDYHLAEAGKVGASASEVRTAVGVARMVRKASDENMDAYTDGKLGGQAPELKAPSACCSGDGRNE